MIKLVSCFNKEGRTRFAKQVRKYITEAYYPLKERDSKILRDNILFVYKIRNLIVHNKLRLSTDNLMFCKKAIGTLLYIYGIVKLILLKILLLQVIFERNLIKAIDLRRRALGVFRVAAARLIILHVDSTTLVVLGKLSSG